MFFKKVKEYVNKVIKNLKWKTIIIFKLSKILNKEKVLNVFQF